MTYTRVTQHDMVCPLPILIGAFVAIVVEVGPGLRGRQPASVGAFRQPSSQRLPCRHKSRVSAAPVSAYRFGGVTPDKFSYAQSLAFLAFAYLGGIATVYGSLWGGLLVAGGLLFTFLNETLGVPSEFILLQATSRQPPPTRANRTEKVESHA